MGKGILFWKKYPLPHTPSPPKTLSRARKKSTLTTLYCNLIIQIVLGNLQKV